MTAALTIPGLAAAAATRWPARPAIIDGDLRLDFQGLDERMRACAGAFVSAGLKRGERVALWAPNALDWIVVCLGLQAAGGVLVPLNTRFKGAEAQFILNRAAVAMLVVADEFLGVRYADLLDGLDLPALRRVVRLGAAGPDGWEAFLDAATSADRREADRRLDQLSPDDIGDIMFTSGTTGEPKGAVTSHRQTVETAKLWAKATMIGEGDRFLILWPFFHCSGYKAGWVVNLAVGATTLPERVLDTTRLLETVAREAVTFLPGPPALFQTLLAMSESPRAAMASVRVSVTGASAVAPTMIEAMRKDLGIPVVLTGYGLTETCGTVTMTCPEDPLDIVTTSCGRAIDGVELACVDADGRPVPTGEAGEVVVRGMNVMIGYLDDPIATGEAIDSEGWLHTGDVGVLDEQGYLRITDRKKDIYITGGFNCYPAEIEKMLLAHPAILQVAVTGIADSRLGEVGMAYVVLKDGASLDADALIAWSRERMANYKVPRRVAFLDVLPANATGKVQKFKLGAA